MASLQPLPSFGDPFLGTGGGMPQAPNWPTIHGPEMGGGGVLGLPDIVVTPKPGGGSTAAVQPQTGGAYNSIISCITSPGTCLLRFVLLILGLICVAGAIYLYKPTSEVVAGPARAVRDAAIAA